MIKLKMPHRISGKEGKHQQKASDGDKRQLTEYLSSKTGKCLFEQIRLSPRLLSIKGLQQHYDDLMGRAASAGQDEKLAFLLQNELTHRLIFSLADHSPFLWRIILNDPSCLVSILENVPEESHEKLVHEQMSCIMDQHYSDTYLMQCKRQLRRQRKKHALLVALADLGGVWNVENVTRSLSEFAEASIKGALRAVLRVGKEKGHFLCEYPEDIENGSGIVILALGKLGARELNYSSDVDLIVFFNPDTTCLSGKIAPNVFYVKVAQQLACLLQERTADGFVHRVDYRLRPDPGSTPVALSLGSARVYYETIGQNWERAALIKARAVAGDIAIGEQFLQELEPFIWRRYFDFSSIADIHAMKRQIHAVRGYDEITIPGYDVKLGRGGIREIEFFVQTQQLVFGGRCPKLRGARTLDMLSELESEEWINPDARDELGTAYRFLRTVEHRLQMVADEQTQILPTETPELERFSRFCGFASEQAFSRHFIKHAENVRKHYALLFEEKNEPDESSKNFIFSGGGPHAETLDILKKTGFLKPERAWDIVNGWYTGRRQALLSVRARNVLNEIIPAFLEALGVTADPDNALELLDQAFSRMPAAAELLTIINANEKLRVLFADLLGSAPRLAEIVSQAPHVLDMVIDPSFSDPVYDEETIGQIIHKMIGRPSHFEALLDNMRDVTRQMSFLTGARMLSGVVPLVRSGEVYSAIAQTMVKIALEGVLEEFRAEYGIVPGASMIVMALGRLGARQMTASSDLDLIVLYDFHEETRESDGAKKIDATMYYARLTKRLFAALTVPTRRGLLYEVDLRLRPEGKKGPVATQFEGFFNYQYHEADLWEHMALTRARPIAGDAGLADRAEKELKKLLSIRREADNVFLQAREMRAMIADKKGSHSIWDLKLANGGILDLDFLAQSIVLTKASEFSQLLGLRTDEVFREAEKQQILSDDDAAALILAHQTFYKLQQWLRTILADDFSLESLPSSIMTQCAALFGLPDSDTLHAFVRDLQKTTHDIVLKNMMIGLS